VAETYTVELYAGGPFVGCDSTETVDLSEYGYTDEEWDKLPIRKREELLEEWGEGYFWNEGYEFNAEVKKNG
jgi:hypothetical protein